MALPLYLILMVYYKYLNRFKGASVALKQPPPFCVHRNRRQSNNESSYQTAITGIDHIIYGN